MMMVVSDEEMELELVRLSGVKSEVITAPQRGRKLNSIAVPDEIRKLIAADALDGVSAKDLSDAYGVSQSSISAYKHDATSTTTYDSPDKGLKDHNDKVRARISNKAQSKLVRALKYMTDDKLESAKATDLSQIAANMARVVEKTAPKQAQVVVNNIQFYSPHRIKPENFEVVDAIDQP